ncbi:class F sortase [Streptomyces chengbuensis]|uniref:class F sortase n=1 Tax=Streptomyces TaxID=1883 RepID=UPI0025B5152D|nr:class F sortase [Streptomyces sp. HUAS CB01]WJY53215.1 class F sortase [Streptomyces sp. HUAS CB01]
MNARQPLGSQTPPEPAPSRSLGQTLLWPVVAAALGGLLCYNSLGGQAANTPQARPASPAPAPVSPPKAAPVHPPLPRSVPTRIAIPAISVNAPFTVLTLNKAGQLNAPPPNDKNLVGWYGKGSTPGEKGTSILAGHLDTMTGPAVFESLSALKPGNKIDITRQDRKVATFKVDSVETFSKAAFPSARVYNDAPTAQLRLITCGGLYDKKTKDYKDNIVVFAHLDSVKNG